MISAVFMISGSLIRHSIDQADAPSRRAASIRLGGTPKSPA